MGPIKVLAAEPIRALVALHEHVVPSIILATWHMGSGGSFPRIGPTPRRVRLRARLPKYFARPEIWARAESEAESRPASGVPSRDAVKFGHDHGVAGFDVPGALLHHGAELGFARPARCAMVSVVVVRTVHRVSPASYTANDGGDLHDAHSAEVGAAADGPGYASLRRAMTIGMQPCPSDDRWVPAPSSTVGGYPCPLRRLVAARALPCTFAPTRTPPSPPRASCAPPAGCRSGRRRRLRRCGCRPRRRT
jgi:hypothetical protein